MKEKLLELNRQSEWFYRQFAQENQIEFLDLCIMDHLFNHAGCVTWNHLFHSLGFPRVSILRSVRMLEKEGALKRDGDRVMMTDYGRFETQDLIDELHARLEDVITELEDTQTPTYWQA